MSKYLGLAIILFVVVAIIRGISKTRIRRRDTRGIVEDMILDDTVNDGDLWD